MTDASLITTIMALCAASLWGCLAVSSRQGLDGTSRTVLACGAVLSSLMAMGPLMAPGA